MIDQYFQIQLLMAQIIKNLKQIPQHHTSVYFMGESGSGKSTLINFLIKNQHLQACYSQTGDMIMKLNQKTEEDIQISEYMNSKTSVPKQIQYKGQIYKDFPGFHDNREENALLNQDIINQFYIKEVFSKTQKFKIVFVTSRAGISDRATQFLHSIRIFSRQFKDIKPILPSICLVVSKVDLNISLTHIKASLKKIQTQLLEQLTQNQRDLLQHFVENSKIQIFYFPKSTGLIDFSLTSKMYKMIQSLKYGQLLQQIHVSVQNHSHMKIHGLIQKWNNQISLTVGEVLLECLSVFFKQQFLQFQDIEESNKIIERFIKYLQQFQSLSHQQHQKFINLVKKTPRVTNCGDKDAGRNQRIHIEQLYSFLDFFKIFEVQAFDVIKWKDKIHRIKGYLQQLVEEPRFIILSNPNSVENIVHLKGFYCNSHHIQKAAQKMLQQKDSIYCTKQLIVTSYLLNLNENITIPGCDLIIMTEHIKIPRSININLKGSDAQDFDSDEEQNMNGMPGLPGQNGGNLFIRCRFYKFQLSTINIDIRGGTGGKGRNGGLVRLPIKERYFKTLKDDLKKSTKDKQFLIQRAQYKFSDKNFTGKLIHVLRSLGTFNDQILEKYSTINYKKQNFLQTIGGCTGLNGNMGRLEIRKIPYEIELKKTQNPNKSFGHKQVYEAIYMKQMVFASIRKEGKALIQSQKIQKSEQQSQSNKKICSEKKIHTNLSLRSSHASSRKSSIQISEFTLDPEKEQQDNLFEEFEIQKQKNFANDIGKISNEKDFETELLMSLFKFNDDQAKRKKSRQIKNIQQEKQEHEHERPNESLNGTGLFKIQETSTKYQTEQKKQHFVRKSQNMYFNEKSINSKLGVKQKQTKKQAITKHQTVNVQKMPHHESNQNEVLVRKQTIKNSLQTSNYVHKQSDIQRMQQQRCVRRRYLETNFELLSKSQLLELIRMRAQAKQKLIVTNHQRDKFALMISKQLLNQFGKEIATDIGTEMIQTVGNNIVKNVGSEMVKQTGKQFSKEILIKSTQGIGKGYLGHQLIGSEVSSTFKEITKFSTQSSISASGIGETLLGISKSFILQSVISFILASGITDKWLIQPHFESKVVQGNRWNDEGLIQPVKKQQLKKQLMQKCTKQWDVQIEGYKRQLNYICKQQL